MAVDYNDPRFQQVNQEKQTALNEVNSLYNNMVNNSDKYYEAQLKATEDYGNKQAEIQQQNTDFAIEKINQQKEQTKEDYTKEQKGAYADWQKQSNQYGVNAESMAMQGLNRTGYSESSQVNMYNTYQNRLSNARQLYQRAVLEYDNAIKEAQLKNNATLSEIAYNTLKTKLELSLQGFQYKNTLLQAQLEAKNNTEDRYYARWKNVLDQINTENTLKEQQRQFDEQMKLSREQLNWQKQQAKLVSSGGSGGSGDSVAIDKNGQQNNTKNGTKSPTSIKVDGKTYYSSNEWKKLGFKKQPTIAELNQAVNEGKLRAITQNGIVYYIKLDQGIGNVVKNITQQALNTIANTKIQASVNPNVKSTVKSGGSSKKTTTTTSKLPTIQSQNVSLKSFKK